MEKLVIIVDNQKINVVYTNKKIKTRRLSIKQNGIITISGYNMPRKEIEKIIIKNYAWIEKQLKKLNDKKQAISFDEIKEHNIIWIFGKTYQLKQGTKYDFLDKTSSIATITYPQEVTKEDAFNTICNITSKYLEERIKYYANIFCRKPILVIKDMKSKYGYCMYKNNKIVLSKRLVHYDKQIIDYVIVHEFCHFLVPNHSKEFYKEVEKILPNYKNIIKELKKFNYLCKY